MVLSVLVFSLGVRINQTTTKASELSPEWLSIAKTFLELNKLGKEKAIETLKSEIKNTLLPISKFTLTEEIVNSEINSVSELGQEWLKELEPLLVYRFSLDGLISAKSNSDYFTNDLEKVLNNIQPLLLKTKDKWNSLGTIKWILANFSSIRVKTLIRVIDDIFTWVDNVYPKREELLQLLGHQTRQRFLIFNQNIGEARPTGGFIGSYIPVEVFKGRITIDQSQTIYHVDGSKPFELLTHPASWYYSNEYDLVGEGGIRNINFFPCFPTTAAAVQREFAKSSNGFSSDAIIFINPQFLESVWPNDLIIQDETVGEINKINFLEQIEKLTSPSLNATDLKNPKAEISNVAETFIANFSKILNEKGGADIAYEIALNLLKRDLQIWFNNQNIQTYWEETGLGGTNTCKEKNKTPNASFILANLSADKRNLITQNQFSFSSEKFFNGNRITFNYAQVIPEKVNLLRGYNWLAPLTFVGLQIPDEATEIKIESSQALSFAPLRKNYFFDVTEFYGKEPKYIDEAKTVINSIIEIENGYIYTQPDGSRVVGAYIRDEEISNVKFSFFLPSSVDYINFNSQPGLVSTSLSLGNGINFLDFPEIKYVNNPDSIAIGKTLLIP
jgi:hypothetical protein